MITFPFLGAPAGPTCYVCGISPDPESGAGMGVWQVVVETLPVPAAEGPFVFNLPTVERVGRDVCPSCSRLQDPLSEARRRRALEGTAR